MENRNKMTDLAQTLRKQGLAASCSDAIRLADSVQSTQMDNDQAHRNNFGDNLAIKSSPTQGLGERKMQDTLTKDQIVNVLQQFADKFCQEINNINSKLEKLESDMAKQSNDAQATIKTQENDNTEIPEDMSLNEMMEEPVETEQMPEMEKAEIKEETKPQRPINPQDNMMGSVDLVDTFNVNKK